MKNILAAITVLISFSVLVACKKKSTEPGKSNKSTSELLIGEWIITHEGEDDNNNGTLEDGEKEIRDGNYHMRFDGDGHAIKTFPATPTNWYNYTWTVDGNTLILTESGKNPRNHDIEAISETELRYRYKNGISTRYQWAIYKKK